MNSTVTAQATIYIDNVSSGTIVMWSQTNIPEGWIICDGNNGQKVTLSNGAQISVPDLRDKFVQGVGSESVNQSGAADTHSHQVTTEEISLNFNTSTDGTHSHKMPSSWYSRNLSCGDHTGVDTGSTDVKTVTTQESGSHNHQVVQTINPQTLTTTTNNGLRPSWYALYYLLKL